MEKMNKKPQNYFSKEKRVHYYLEMLNLGLGFYRGLFSNLSGLKSPLLCGHKVTYRCNLRCKMCPFWKRNEQDLTYEKEKVILEKIRKAGVCFVAFEGGEPLLRKDLGEILAFSRSLGLQTSLVTNGTLLKQRINEITEYINGAIYVSIDGLEDTHDKIRGVSGCFKKAMDGIMACKNKTFVGINTTIMQENIHEIVDLLKLARELDIGISLALAYEYENACVSSSSISSLKRELAQVIRMKKQGYPVVNSLNYLKILCYEKSWRCKPWTIINVDPKGNLVLPCYVRGEYKGSNSIFHVDIRRIWRTHDWEKVKNCVECSLHCYVEPSLILSFDFNTYFNWMQQDIFAQHIFLRARHQKILGRRESDRNS